MANIDQEYLDRREELRAGKNVKPGKWTIAMHPRLKAGLKILADDRGMQYMSFVERIILEALTPEEWRVMMDRLLAVEVNAGEPEAGKDTDTAEDDK